MWGGKRREIRPDELPQQAHEPIPEWSPSTMAMRERVGTFMEGDRRAKNSKGETYDQRYGHDEQRRNEAAQHERNRNFVGFPFLGNKDQQTQWLRNALNDQSIGENSWHMSYYSDGAAEATFVVTRGIVRRSTQSYTIAVK